VKTGALTATAVRDAERLALAVGVLVRVTLSVEVADADPPSERLGVGEGVPLAVRLVVVLDVARDVREREPVRVGVAVGVRERELVALRESDTLGVADALAPRVIEPVGDSETVLELLAAIDALLDGVRVPEPEREPVGVGVTESDAVALPESDTVGVIDALAPRVTDAVKEVDSVLEPLAADEGVTDGVGVADGVGDGVIEKDKDEARQIDSGNT
jgi:hypothetical protein